ncbi:hypothetical protein L0F63_006277 [Massospora cicadina]|nr:hypothetical protein L0F63_006277 [Massospora cicadina]
MADDVWTHKPNLSLVEKEADPVYRVLPWYIWEEIMIYLPYRERLYFPNARARKASPLVPHKFSELQFTNKKPRFSYHTAKQQVGPHVETLKLDFIRPSLIIHKFCWIEQSREIPFRNFLSSVQGTLKHLNMGFKGCANVRVYLSLLPNLESLRLTKIKPKPDEFGALVKHIAIHNKKLTSLGLKAIKLAKYHFEVVLRELPQLVALHLQNTHNIPSGSLYAMDIYEPSVVTLKDLSFGKLKSLAIINGRKRAKADSVALDLTDSNIEEFALDYHFKFVQGDLTAASWPHVKKLEITQLPKITLKCFGDKFQGVETLRALAELPKLRFLKLYGLLNPDYFLFCPEDFSLKVTHLEVLFECPLLMHALAAVARSFPHLMFLAIRFNSDIIMDIPFDDSVRFPHLGFMRWDSEPSLEAITLFLKTTPELLTLYLNPETLRTFRKVFAITYPKLNVLNYKAVPQFFV